MSISFSDKIKYDRLCETFSRNFKITELYATYLERFPDIITKELVDTLTEDGVIGVKDAISALLCEHTGEVSDYAEHVYTDGVCECGKEESIVPDLPIHPFG